MADEKFFKFEKLTEEEAARLKARERPGYHYWRLGHIGLDLRPVPEGKGKINWMAWWMCTAPTPHSFHFGEGAIRNH